MVNKFYIFCLPKPFSPHTELINYLNGFSWLD